jgi:hypothetical protein
MPPGARVVIEFPAPCSRSPLLLLFHIPTYDWSGQAAEAGEVNAPLVSVARTATTAITMTHANRVGRRARVSGLRIEVCTMAPSVAVQCLSPGRYEAVGLATR